MIPPSRVPSPSPGAPVAERKRFTNPEAAVPLPATKPNGDSNQAVSAPLERPPLPQTPIANIAAAICAVMSDLEAVPKAGTNTFHRYKYAQMQDLLQILTPLMGKHGIAILQDEVSRAWVSQRYVSVTYQFTIMHKSGEVWPQQPRFTGLSMAQTEKGNFDDKCINKAATAASKYFLMRTFNVPTEDVDDADKGPAKEQQQRVPSPGQQRLVPAPGSSKPQPYAIPIISGEQPKAWAGRYFKMMATAETVAELDLWDKLNAQALAKVQEKDEATYLHLYNNFTSRRVALDQPQQQTATEWVPHNPPGKMLDDPEAFLTWLEEQSKHFHGLPAFNEWWNTVVEAHLEGAFPTDRQEAIKIFERHELRLQHAGT
jgi:hypothetical protein